jgi:hypothetical protein
VYDCHKLVDIFILSFLFSISESCRDRYRREPAAQLPTENRHVLIEIGSPMRNMWTSSP